MKTIYAVILAVVLLLASACAQKVNDPADVQAVKKSVEDFVKAFNAGDANGIASLMTDKVTFANLNVPVAVGKDAVRSDFQAAFEQVKGELSCPVEDVTVTGGLAVARGTFTDTITPKAEGIAPITYHGSWIVKFARQNDGSWKWDWLVGNSDQPAPGSTATGEDEQALMQIEREGSEALVKKDITTLDKLLAKEFHASYLGMEANKQQFLTAIKSGSTKYESAVNSEMKAFVFGDRAVVDGLSTEKSSAAGKDTSGRYHWTDLFVKRDGRWQCVAGYSAKAQ